MQYGKPLKSQLSYTYRDSNNGIFSRLFLNYTSGRNMINRYFLFISNFNNDFAKCAT